MGLSMEDVRTAISNSNAAGPLGTFDGDKRAVTIGINETYRPYEEQVQLAETKGLYSKGGLAAKPGTSEHGWGIAADLQLNGAAQAWMQRNAPSYGFKADVAGESWHWAYHPAG